nr:uncharacterized protein LOC111518299 [Leptinotarsa decemlineata]
MNIYVDVLANLIIQQYFMNCRCLLAFTDYENRFYFNGVLPIVNIRVNISKTCVHPEVFLRYYGCQGIIVKSNKPTVVFRTIEHEIRLTTERFNNRKYLFLPGDDMMENMKDIFGMKELHYVADMVVANSEKDYNGTNTFFVPDEILSLWTHKYMGTEDNINGVFLDKWFSKNNSYKLNKYLYQNKLINQMKRKIQFATFQYEPYSVIGSSEIEHKGSEMMTALLFAKQYNMTPQLVINQEGYWGDIFENWTGYGLLGNLLKDGADVGFSALYTWEADYHFLDLSKPMIRTGITCLVPAPKLAAGWLTPLYSYSKAMWVAVGSMFFVCILVQSGMHYIQRKSFKCNTKYINGLKIFSQSVFCIAKLFVQQVVSRREMPEGSIGKYFMGFLFTFSLFLSSSYSSGLSTIMTLPRYSAPINTVEEFVNSGLLWGATQNGWILSIEKAEDVIIKKNIYRKVLRVFSLYTMVLVKLQITPLYKTIVSRFVPTNEEKLRELSKTSNFAFSLERLPNKNYAIGSYIKKDVIGNFHLMKEDFYWEQCVMMTRKSSVLLPLLDSFILRVFETGLISHWQNEATRSSMDSSVQKAVKFYYYNHKNRNFVVKLKWIHVRLKKKVH